MELATMHGRTSPARTISVVSHAIGRSMLECSGFHLRKLMRMWRELWEACCFAFSCNSPLLSFFHSETAFVLDVSCETAASFAYISSTGTGVLMMSKSSARSSVVACRRGRWGARCITPTAACLRQPSRKNWLRCTPAPLKRQPPISTQRRAWQDSIGPPWWLPWPSWNGEQPPCLPWAPQGWRPLLRAMRRRRGMARLCGPGLSTRPTAGAALLCQLVPSPR